MADGQVRTPDLPGVAPMIDHSGPLPGISQPKILIINTGGTISCKTDPVDGKLRVVRGALAEAMQRTQAFVGMPYDIKELDPFLDSSEMTPPNWRQIAQIVYEEYSNYRGFVVAHGTDTLAYTAAALSFLLEDIAVPIVLTGSQIPFEEQECDALSNLWGACHIANHGLWKGVPIPLIPEVMVYFNRKLMRGTRVSKMDATTVDAFFSNNCGLVGMYDGKFEFDYYFIRDLQLSLLRKDYSLGASKNIDTEPFDIRLDDQQLPRLKAVHLISTRVYMLHMYPGFDIGFLQRIIETNPKEPFAVVIKTFGVGNVPSSVNELFRNFPENGIVAICTECAKGAASSVYGTGADANHTVNLGDMTAECAYTKLCVLLGNPRLKQLPMDKLAAKVSRHLQHSIRGEISTSRRAQSEKVKLYR